MNPQLKDKKTKSSPINAFQIITHHYVDTASVEALNWDISVGHMPVRLYLVNEALAAICLICALAEGENLAEINLISPEMGTSRMEI